MRAFLVLFAVLSLSACQLVDGPSMMPTGYKYHSEPYKSQTGHDPHHCAHKAHHAGHDAHHDCGCDGHSACSGGCDCADDGNCGCSHGCECSGHSACGCSGGCSHDEEICVVNEEQDTPICSSCQGGYTELQPPKRLYNE